MTGGDRHQCTTECWDEAKRRGDRVRYRCRCTGAWSDWEIAPARLLIKDEWSV